MYSFSSHVRFSEVDQDQKITLHSILNYFQDCSTFHSAATHMDITQLKEYGYAWILASWQVVVDRYPVIGEEITVSTWAYDFKGFLAYRNFTMKDASGKVCAYANTIWTFLNLSTMHPAKILPDVAAAYEMFPEYPMEKAPRKIALAGEGASAHPQTVMKYQIDVNHHVNNAMYISMAQEYLPDDFEVWQMRTEYKNAATLGETIYPTLIQNDNLFQVVLKSSEGLTYAIVEFQRRPLC